MIPDWKNDEDVEKNEREDGHEGNGVKIGYILIPCPLSLTKLISRSIGPRIFYR